MSVRSEFEKFPLIAISKRIKKANALISREMQWSLYIVALLISDGVMTSLAFSTAYYFRFVLFVQYFDQDATVTFATYQILLYAMPFLWLVIFAANGLYIKDNLLGGTQEYSKTFRSATTGFLVIVIAGFLGPSLIFARGWLFNDLGLYIYFCSNFPFFVETNCIWLTQVWFFSDTCCDRWRQSGRSLVGRTTATLGYIRITSCGFC